MRPPNKEEKGGGKTKKEFLLSELPKGETCAPIPGKGFPCSRKERVGKKSENIKRLTSKGKKTKIPVKKKRDEKREGGPAPLLGEPLLGRPSGKTK